MFFFANGLDYAQITDGEGDILQKLSWDPSSNQILLDASIVEVKGSNRKSQFAEEILRSLPEWFGNEEALNGYVEGVASLPFWVALSRDGKCIGFISIKMHYGYTGDIYVLGVLPEYHRKGVGRLLLAKAEEYFRTNNCKYIIVKTLSDIVDYEPYKRTREFYKSVGFEELITLTEMWDSENPCLIMIKVL